VIAERLRVVDEASADVLAEGESIGEVVARGNDVMLGYYRDEVAVVPVPHERWGERPRAFVVPRPGAMPHPRDLDRHVRARLAGFQAPDAYELPKTATGKVRKFILRERVGNSGSFH
jgi:fatty-acyl-CoA synthase